MPDDYTNPAEFPEKPEVNTRDLIDEALATQAARRPKRTPPNIMPLTPSLPKVPKPKRKRRK